MSYELTVAKGVDQWLRAEVLESKSSRNSIWDNHDEIRASYSNDLPNNSDALKVGGHFSRFQMLASAYPELYEDDRFTGKLIHHALMLVSGNFRTQCHLRAGDQQVYEHLRYGWNGFFNGAASPSIYSAVGQGVDYFGGFDAANLDTIISKSKQLNTSIYEKHLEVYRWHAENPERAMDAIGLGEAPVRAVFECQELALQLAAGHISLAGQLRGDVAGVPLLESKSITDANEISYPFAPIE